MSTSSPLHSRVYNSGKQLSSKSCKSPAVGRRGFSPRSWTPLHRAAIRGKINILTALLKRGRPDIDKEDSRCRTALHHAVINGHLGAVKLLIAHNASVAAKADASFTPLTFAARYGKLEIFNLLLENGASVSTLSSTARTPLHYAAMHGYVKIAKILLERGVSPQAQDKERCTALDYAVCQRHWDVVKLLFKDGHRRRFSSQAEPQEDNTLPAATVGDEAIISALNKETETCRRTPLEIAARLGLDDLVHRLVNEHGCHPLGPRWQAVTPLYIAVENGHQRCVDILVSCGADIDDTDPRWESPLECALRLRHDDIAGILYDAGAKSLLSPAQSKFYDICEAGSTTEVRRLLQAGGADVNAAGLRNRTPLHAAAQRGHLEIVKLLVEHGADVTATTFFGSTAEALAKKFDHKAIASFLKATGKTAGIADQKAARGAGTAGSSTSEQGRVEQDQPREQQNGQQQDI